MLFCRRSVNGMYDILLNYNYHFSVLRCLYPIDLVIQWYLCKLQLPTGLQLTSTLSYTVSRAHCSAFCFLSTSQQEVHHTTVDISNPGYEPLPHGDVIVDCRKEHHCFV